jgi:chitinase
MSLWGVTYTLNDPKNNKVGSPISGSGLPGNCTKQAGYLSYFEIKSLAFQPTYDTVGVCDFFVYNGNQWVGYDDVDSFKGKMDYYKSKNLGGVSIWGMDSDIPISYPLTKFLNSQL